MAVKRREKLLQTETNIGVAGLIHFLSYSTVYEDRSAQTGAEKSVNLLQGNSAGTEENVSGLIQETAKTLEEICITAMHKYVLQTSDVKLCANL